MKYLGYFIAFGIPLIGIYFVMGSILDFSTATKIYVSIFVFIFLFILCLWIGFSVVKGELLSFQEFDSIFGDR